MVAGPSIIMLASMFGGILGGLPLGVPPLPEDSAISRAAPGECLWYFSSAGMATPDAESSNQTEQLFAEPELQKLVATVENQILRAIRREFRGREERVLAAEAPKLVKVAMTRPLAVYVSEVRPPGPGGPPSVQAGLVCNLGEQADTIEVALRKLVSLTGADSVIQHAGGIQWSNTPLPPDAPPVRWAVHEGYLLIAVGKGEDEALAERMAASGNGPAWLADIKSDIAPERVSTIGYINVTALVEQFGPMLGPNQGALSHLGLDNVQSIISASGLDDTACVSRAKIVIDGEPKGIFALLPEAPLSKRDLAMIPSDVTAAVAMRLDAEKTLKGILDIVEAFEPRARDKFEDGLRDIEEEINIDIREDLLASLDDTGVLYLPGGELFTSWIGTTAVVKIKDRQRLEAGIDKFVARARMELGRHSRRGSGEVVRKTKYNDQIVHFFSIPDSEMPFAPAWCITDDYLVIGLMPQTVKTFLARGDDAKSLTDVPQVADALAASDGPACVSYVDMEQLVRGVYPLVQIGVRMMCVELRREGIDVDVSLLPSVESIAPHLVPGISTWARTGDGFLFECRQSLPGGGGSIGLAPAAVAMLLPATQGARSAAREAQEMNNLKQIGLAFHNYADAHEKFPSNIYNEDGKPLLSWRVQLLPYFEEGAIYDEFHLDEPWDSEHNKKLIAKMPQFFVSPGVPAAPGKTRYVALAGEGTLFPGNEKLSFRHVTDGTSMTLMFVRSSPQLSAIWTKPDDIAFDPKKPKKGLDSPKGYFLAAFADGHVRRLSLGLSDETVKNLALRADGEVIDYEDFDVPHRPSRRRAREFTPPAEQ